MTTTIAKGIAVSCVTLMFCAAVQAAGRLPLAWEVKGLKNPESIAYDSKSDKLYVANVDGRPGLLDGKGGIALLDAKGKMIELNWRANLSAPKGLVATDKHLYLTDVDRLLRVNFEKKQGVGVDVFLARGAKFFNDAAVAANGDVYVSDTSTSHIWRLRDETFEKWLAVDSASFCLPNGLHAGKDALIVACWMRKNASGVEGPGPLLSVSYADKKITALGDGKPIGYLDGIQPDGSGGYYLSDWLTGGILHWTAAAGAREIARFEPGTADILYLRDKNLLIVPFMKDDVVRAYRMPKPKS
jgi:sugar lactone lactonase YvrE